MVLLWWSGARSGFYLKPEMSLNPAKRAFHSWEKKESFLTNEKDE